MMKYTQKRIQELGVLPRGYGIFRYDMATGEIICYPILIAAMMRLYFSILLGLRMTWWPQLKQYQSEAFQAGMKLSISRNINR